MIDGLPPCQLISGANGLAIGTYYSRGAGQTQIQVVLPNRRDPAQLWQCIQYFDTDGFALVTMVNGELLCLSAPGGVEWPFLTTFSWDGANLWNLDSGLSAVRDSDYCLTIYGEGTSGAWAPGTPVQMYPWQGNYTNQLWSIATVS
jgi:hypothetical protein